MATEILTHPSQLQAIAPEWRELAAGRANAFVTPDWYLAWLHSYGGGAEPWVPVVRDEHEGLIGLMPLARTAGRRPALQFAGSNLGDLFHPVSRDEAGDAAVARAVAGELAGARDWASLLLENVPAGAPWLAALEQSAPGLRTTRVPHRDEVLPAIPLGERGWDGYLAERSRNFRSQLGRKQRGLEREGSVRFRRSDDPALLGRDLDAFFGLHDARWEGRGGSQALTERSREFHRAFAAAAQGQGWLRLWFLELDSEPIAAWYGWLLGGRYAYYLAGFDGRFSRWSVGQLLLAHTIRSAFDEGADEYDLLLGGEEYKSRFAETALEVRTVAVTRPWSPARAAIRAESLGRRAADRLSPELREAIKRPLRGLTRRSPSKVER